MGGPEKKFRYSILLGPTTLVNLQRDKHSPSPFFYNNKHYAKGMLVLNIERKDFEMGK